MKKIAQYITIGLLGFTAGYLLFSNTLTQEVTTTTMAHNDNIPWTCSMHPQVKAHEQGSCPMCGMDLVQTQTNSDHPMHLVPIGKEALLLGGVETMTIGSEKNTELSILVSGEIKTNKNTDAVQTTIFAGRIDDFFKNTVGEKVKKGEKIGMIYSPELYSSQDKLITAKSYKESHIELYNTARNTSGLWKITDEQINELFKNDTPVFNFPLVADFNGSIIEVYVEKGKFYPEGSPLYKVSDLRIVWAILDVNEQQIPLIHVGKEITIKGQTTEEKTITAKIDLIEPTINTNSRTVKVRAIVDNSKGVLRPGTLVNAEIKVNNPDEISVPKSAIIWTGKNSLVYVKPIANEDVFELREVILGASYSNYYQVLNGLSIGDEIVTEGAFLIDAAAQLSGKPGMMNYGYESNSIGKKPVSSTNTNIPHQERREQTHIWLTEEENIRKMINHYFLFKDALVLGDFKEAQKEALSLKEHITKLKTTLPALENLEVELVAMQKSKDLESMRGNFIAFNKDLVALLKTYYPASTPLYVQFCPMADDNKGAVWLSNEAEIRNPYFGNKMLSCGLVQTVIKAQTN